MPEKPSSGQDWFKAGMHILNLNLVTHIVEQANMAGETTGALVVYFGPKDSITVEKEHGVELLGRVLPSQEAPRSRIGPEGA